MFRTIVLARHNSLIGKKASRRRASQSNELADHGTFEACATDQQMQDAELRRLAQADRLRDEFFRLATRLSTTLVAASIFLVIAIGLLDTELGTPVAVALISGLAAQSIGIQAIMASYLFKKD